MSVNHNTCPIQTIVYYGLRREPMFDSVLRPFMFHCGFKLVSVRRHKLTLHQVRRQVYHYE